MTGIATPDVRSEEDFAALVDALTQDKQREQLIDLLREDHAFYEQRGAATIVEMRGWVLLALGKIGIADDSLVFVLEELDTGVDPYLVAASACALRSYPNPNSALTPFVMRALTQIRYHDDPISFQAYGDYATSSTATSPVRELLITLAWLGPHASSALPEIEAVAKSRGLSKKALLEANRTIEVIRAAVEAEQPASSEDCCSLPASLTSKFSWSRHSRQNSQPVEQVVFEDQDGAPVSFKEFFHGHPSIVVFFYTRCGNPLKCSLTVTKLARVQKLLESLGLIDQIHTAAISYDPAFDLANRMRRYGENRAVRLDEHHRLLRSPDGMNALRSHFKLGVNFIESLVSRHRVEAYVLDAEGRIAASFERLHWDEQELVNKAADVLKESSEEAAPENYQTAESAYTARPISHAVDSSPSNSGRLSGKSSPVWATLASLGVAFFPKCPICWAAYLSVFGIAGLNQIPYSPWLQPILIVVMLINLVSVWLRGWSTNRLVGPYLVTAGALIIILSRMSVGLDKIALWGVVLTMAGSMLSALGSWRRQKAHS